MAIAMARAGGLGVIHRFLTIEQQVAEVERVKRAESFVIDEALGDRRPTPRSPRRAELMRSHEVKACSSTRRGRLRRHPHARATCAPRAPGDDRSARYATPRERLVTAAPGIDLDEARELLHRHRRREAAAGRRRRHAARPRSRCATSTRCASGPTASKDARGRLLVAAAIGVRGDYARARRGAGRRPAADALVLDIAHGHADHAVARARAPAQRRCPTARSSWPATSPPPRAPTTSATPAPTPSRSASARARACTTRIVAGVGVPQLTAVLDCGAACARHGVPVIADGGIRVPGDVAKAIAAGAETVMVGNLLAGTDESPGTVVSRAGRTLKVYRGMALGRGRPGSGWRPRASSRRVGTRVRAGRAGGRRGRRCRYRGEAGARSCAELVGGLRSAMSYSDAHTIDEFHANARFVRITTAGLIESPPARRAPVARGAGALPRRHAHRLRPHGERAAADRGGGRLRAPCAGRGGARPGRPAGHTAHAVRLRLPRPRRERRRAGVPTAREVEDLAALVDAAGGAAFALGVSAGAVLALDAAAQGVPLTRLALWEPPLLVDRSRPPLAPEYEQRLRTAVAEGRPGDAVALCFGETLPAGSRRGGGDAVAAVLARAGAGGRHAGLRRRADGADVPRRAAAGEPLGGRPRPGAGAGRRRQRAAVQPRRADALARSCPTRAA